MPEPLDRASFAAVGALWRSQRREITTSFGGESMQPSITAADEVSVRCGDEPRAGDVVLYFAGDRPVLHRVIRVDAQRVWTRGDNNLLPDQPHPLAEVVGRAIRIRKAGENDWREVADAPRYATREIVFAFARHTGRSGVRLLWRLRSLWLVATLQAPRRPDGRPASGERT